MAMTDEVSTAHASVLHRAILDTVNLTRYAGSMQWVPATSGNFSVRIDARQCAITASGGFKQDITAESVIVAEIGQLGDPRVAGLSAEAPLHFQLYRDDSEIGAVAHVHTHASAALSRRFESRGYLSISGWELLKAFRGITTHDITIDVPVFSNDQDMDRLAALVHDQRVAVPGVFGYLIAGHGLYAWGADALETRRHVEAFESLLNLQLEEERRS